MYIPQPLRRKEFFFVIVLSNRATEPITFSGCDEMHLQLSSTTPTVTPTAI